MYALGNMLLCDTLQEAKRLCFGGPERHKAVTLDGTLIQKSGLMTGGLSGIEARAARWDERAVDSLKKERDAAMAELAEVLIPHLFLSLSFSISAAPIISLLQWISFLTLQQQVGRQIRAPHVEQQLQSQIDGLEARIRIGRADQKANEDKISSSRKELEVYLSLSLFLPRKILF